MVTSEVRVRYADTDAMGVVYHANYLVWFEVGRNEIMRAYNLPYTDFEKRGIFVPVVSAEIQWKSPARYDEVLQVQTRVADLTPARITFAYRILRKEDQQLLCQGHTVHAFVANGRPTALSKVARDLYEAFAVHVQAEA